MVIPKLKKQQELENARIKYSSTIGLKCSEGEIQWNRYNAMLVANTIIIGLISFTFNRDFNFPVGFKVIFWLTPMLGLLLCKYWYQVTDRGFIWSHFWMKKANEIENQIEGQINPVQEGENLANNIGFGVTKTVSFRIIYIFAAIYALMLINNFIYLGIFIEPFMAINKLHFLYMP